MRTDEPGVPSDAAGAGPGGELVRADDRIIGRAFWISLAVIAGLGLIAGLAMWQAARPKPEPAVPEAAIIAPREVAETLVPAPPPARFTDITAAAGLRFTHENGAYGERLLPETMGGGVAFFDYDDDDDPDLLLVNGTSWPWHRSVAGRPSTSALYRNRGNGTFEDVTAGSGLDVGLYGMGVAVGDYDGDGLVDVYLTGVGEARLFRNAGGGRFEDASLRAGVAGGADDWSSSAAFLDFDRDGDLDLFVGHYVRWSRDLDLGIDYRLAGIGRAYGPPTHYPGTHSRLYRNEGDGRFTDVSAAAGIEIANPATGEPAGKALGVLPVDLDADGFIDLVIANDTVRNFAFHNRGDGRFDEIGVEAGLAFDAEGRATGAMGIDAARYRNDETLAIAIGNFANEMTSFYVAQGDAVLFTDEAVVSGIGPATRQVLTFGVLFLDYDLDGRLDLLQANGHIENDINVVQASQHYAQAPQLFWNCGTNCAREFVEVPAEASGALGRPLVGRGVASADIDLDGDLDLAITQVGGPVVLLRNERAAGHHWIRIKLVGAGANTGAIGASVELRIGGSSQYRSVLPARGYLSQVELPLTFGLGRTDHIDRLIVRWPDGSIAARSGLAVDALHVVRQGE